MISTMFTKSIQAVGVLLAGLLLTAGAFFATPQQASAQSVEDMSVEQLIALIQQLQQLIATLGADTGEGEDGSLVVRTSDANPDATVFQLEVDEDVRHVVFAFDLDADDSDSEIEVSELVIEADVSSGEIGDFIEDVVLIVDGDEIELDDVDIFSDGIDIEIESGELFIEDGEQVTVEVEIEFNSLAAVDQGVIIDFAVAGSDFEAEGSESDIAVTGFAASEEHQLFLSGLFVDPASVETEEFTQGDNDDIGVFEIEFEVTAVEDDFFVAPSAALLGSSLSGAGVLFSFEGPDTNLIEIVEIDLDSTADEVSNGDFLVEEGETEIFSLAVQVTTGLTGNMRMALEEINFTENKSSEIRTLALSPASDFRTAFENVNGSDVVVSEPEEASIELEVVEFSTESVGDVIILSAEFEVEADDGDVFIRNQAFFRGNKLGTPGFHYLLVDENKKLVRGNLSKRKAVITSTADTQGKFFVVEEGETETFTLDVKLSDLKAQEYGLRLFSTNFATSATDPTELVRFSNSDAFGPVVDTN